MQPATLTKNTVSTSKPTGSLYNDEMVLYLQRQGSIKSLEVASAMQTVDRKDFCLDPVYAYSDKYQKLGYGATISAPHIHACALELIKDDLPNAKKILDIGIGSGYSTTCLAVMSASSKATVYAIDHIKDLIPEAKANIKKNHPTLLSRIKFFEGDGRKGLAEYGPFDIIYSDGSFEQLPVHLVDQLTPEGRLVCPVGGKEQHYMYIWKDKNGKICPKREFPVLCSLLVDKEIQWPYCN